MTKGACSQSMTRASLGGAQRLLVVHQPAMSRIGDFLKAELGEGGVEVLLAEVPDAEAAKRIEVAQFLWQIMGQAEFTRTDAVLGLGGAFGISRQRARGLVADVVAAVAGWQECFGAWGVPAADGERLGRDIERRLAGYRG
jgi:hypothetical protein